MRGYARGEASETARVHLRCIASDEGMFKGTAGGRGPRCPKKNRARASLRHLYQSTDYEKVIKVQ